MIYFWASELGGGLEILLWVVADMCLVVSQLVGRRRGEGEFSGRNRNWICLRGHVQNINMGLVE